MLFSSITFLYFFFPLAFMTYHLSPKKYQNATLVFFSLLFFYLGETQYFYLLIIVASVSFLYGKMYDKIKPSYQNLVFVFVLVLLFALLFYFKYFDFMITSLNHLFNLNIKLRHIALPLGISFYIFQASSYVIDVYRQEVKAEQNIINYFAYLTFFPQLIAGPIVRYQDVADDVKDKNHAAVMIEEGTLRFVIGLGKKVLIANALGQIGNEIVGQTAGLYWLSALVFTLQLYFDFSGYSDMAIGMGQMFGIRFLENFNYPFMAESISEFWRRWHISLGIWFKKYVYIPLGGNKVSPLRLIINLGIVWFLTGLWHGASMNFVVWGLLMWGLIVLEKVVFKNRQFNLKPVNILITFMIIVLSFVIFKNDHLSDSWIQIKKMLNPRALTQSDPITRFMWQNNIRLLLISFVLSTPLFHKGYHKIKSGKFKTCLNVLLIIVILGLSTAALVNESYNPFLYFRF